MRVWYGAGSWEMACSSGSLRACLRTYKVAVTTGVASQNFHGGIRLDVSEDCALLSAGQQWPRQAVSWA